MTKPRPDNVVLLSGSTRLDIDPDRVLEEAIGELDSVAVMGFGKNGDLYLAASTTSRGDMPLLIENFKEAVLA